MNAQMLWLQATWLTCLPGTGFTKHRCSYIRETGGIVVYQPASPGVSKQISGCVSGISLSYAEGMAGAIIPALGQRFPATGLEIS